MKFADLHLHSLFSDGTSTPAELVELAKVKGLAAIAVVDHDTIDGIVPALEASATRSIEVVPGIELTAEYDGTEVHLLGYFIDHTCERLKNELSSLATNRVARIYEMVKRLKQLGVFLEADEILKIAGPGSVGRMHIARVMMHKGIISSVNEAFKKYIGDSSPAYVCGFRFSPCQAVRLLQEAGGVAVLAHPYLLHRDELIPELVEYGLKGLEVYYPEHTQSMVNYYLHLAKEYHLLVTGGSDYHGSVKPDVALGSTKVPYELVEALKKAKP